MVAGAGALPRELVGAARRAGREVTVVAIDGMTDAATVDGVPHLWAAPGAFGRILDFLKRGQVEEIVLAGAASRPDWSRISLDWRAIRMLPRLLAADRGDDSLLSFAVGEFEREGFRVVGAHSVAPELVVGPGAAGGVRAGAASAPTSPAASPPSPPSAPTTWDRPRASRTASFWASKARKAPMR